jgi:hypothetical protein
MSGSGVFRDVGLLRSSLERFDNSRLPSAVGRVGNAQRCPRGCGQLCCPPAPALSMAPCCGQAVLSTAVTAGVPARNEGTISRPTPLPFRSGEGAGAWETPHVPRAGGPFWRQPPTARWRACCSMRTQPRAGMPPGGRPTASFPRTEAWSAAGATPMATSAWLPVPELSALGAARGRLRRPCSSEARRGSFIRVASS